MKKVEEPSVFRGKNEKSVLTIQSWVTRCLRMGRDTGGYGCEPKDKIEDRLDRIEDALGFLFDKLVQRGDVDGDELIDELNGYSATTKIVEADE